MTGEPRIPDADRIVREQSHAVQRGTLPKISYQLKETLFRHVDLDQDIELMTFLLRRSRFHVSNRTLEILDGLQDPSERAYAFAQTKDQRGFLHDVLALRTLRYRFREHNFLFRQSGICREHNSLLYLSFIFSIFLYWSQARLNVK